MNSEKSDVCCAIVTYNGNLNVERQVKELMNSCQLIIIDNHSSQDFVDYLINLKLNYSFKLVLNDDNLGLSHALNQGLSYAKENGCKYLLTLDQDSFFYKENIESLISSFAIDQKIASVGPSYKKNENSSFVNYLITSGNIVLVDVLASIGGYDEKLFIDNIDIEISFRLLKNGYKLYLNSDVFFEHKIGEYEKSYIFGIKYLSHSPDRFYWMYRNERYLLRKYRKIFKWLCFKSRIISLLCVCKVLLIERNKFKKIKMIIRGWKDGKLLDIE